MNKASLLEFIEIKKHVDHFWLLDQEKFIWKTMISFTLLTLLTLLLFIYNIIFLMMGGKLIFNSSFLASIFLELKQ